MEAAYNATRTRDTVLGGYVWCALTVGFGRASRYSDSEDEAPSVLHGKQKEKPTDD